MSVPEITPPNKIQRHANNDLVVNAVYRIKPAEPATWTKEGSDNEEVVAPTYDISNKNVCYLAALQHLGIT